VTRLYDAELRLPSSLMSGLRNPDVDAAARHLDAKLVALAVLATGSPA